MAKKNSKGRNRFLWGVVFGVLLAAGVFYLYNKHFSKSEIEKKAEQIQKQARKTTKTAEDKVKKLFD